MDEASGTLELVIVDYLMPNAIVLILYFFASTLPLPPDLCLFFPCGKVHAQSMTRSTVGKPKLRLYYTNEDMRSKEPRCEPIPICLASGNGAVLARLRMAAQNACFLNLVFASRTDLLLKIPVF